MICGIKRFFRDLMRVEVLMGFEVMVDFEILLDVGVRILGLIENFDFIFICVFFFFSVF